MPLRQRQEIQKVLHEPAKEPAKDRLVTPVLASPVSGAPEIAASESDPWPAVPSRRARKDASFPVLAGFALQSAGRNLLLPILAIIEILLHESRIGPGGRRSQLLPSQVSAWRRLT